MLHHARTHTISCVGGILICFTFFTEKHSYFLPNTKCKILQPNSVTGTRSLVSLRWLVFGFSPRKARVQSEGSPRVFCGGRSSTESGFDSSTSVRPCQFSFHINACILWGMDSGSSGVHFYLNTMPTSKTITKLVLRVSLQDFSR